MENKEKKKNKIIEKLDKIILRILFDTSFYKSHKSKIVVGHSFFRFKEIVEEFKESKERFDIGFLSDVLVVIIQTILLLWFFEIKNGINSIAFNIIVTIIGVFVLVYLWLLISILMTIKIYASPILEKMNEMEIKSKAFEKETSLSKEEGAQNLELKNE